MIQRYGLNEQDFRGSLFPDSAVELKGNNDLLCLTAPHLIDEIHRAYLEAGADPADPAAVPRQDLPVSFSPVHRQYGFRPVREWRLERPEMPEPTEHDPMAELQN